ncbi:hypothetical protein BGW38_010140, partial [Lunasporangiospora selenospora]
MDPSQLSPQQQSQHYYVQQPQRNHHQEHQQQSQQQQGHSPQRPVSLFYQDLPSAPALTVTPRSKRPKSLAAHDFMVAGITAMAVPAVPAVAGSVSYP